MSKLKMESLDISGVDDLVSDSQPATQPLSLSSDDGDLEEGEDVAVEPDENDFDPEIWGMLYPISYNLKPVELRGVVTKIGRSTQCEYQILPEQLPVKLVDLFSKCQFIIRKETDGSVFLIDKSTNGTEVNDTKLGKDKYRVLKQNDKISMAKVQAWIFLFTDPTHYTDHPKALRRHYMMSRHLGSGASGDVNLCFRKRDGQRFAVKSIKFEKLEDGYTSKTFFNEVNAYNEARHPCIVKMEEVINTDKGTYIVLEYADKGEFFDRIAKSGGLPEAEARFYFVQALEALDYLHQNGYAHRDLKPENFLLCKSFIPNKYLLKLADFGLAKKVSNDTQLKTFVGTPVYLAPELLIQKFRPERRYDNKVDMWALGCVLFVALCGKYPFDRDSKVKMLPQQIMDVDYLPPTIKDSKERVSDEAADLISKLIVYDPKQRLSAKQALQHPWIQKGFEEVQLAKKVMESVQMRNQDHDQDISSKEMEFVAPAAPANENFPLNQPAPKRIKLCDK